MIENRKPAILIFSTAYLPMIGGAELAIKEIIDRINEYDFLLICARMKKKFPRRERIGNVEVFRVGFGLGFLDKILSPFWGAFLTRDLIKKYDIKLFWAMMVTFTSGAPFLLKLFRLNRNIPILLTLQEGDSESHLKFSNFGLTGVAWFFAARMADRIQAISHYLKEFAKRMGARREIDVVPNGVDFTKFQISKAKLQTNSQAQKRNSKTIITVSRLVRKNGIDILIKAIAEVKKEIQGVRLLILGVGEEEEKLKKLSKDLNLEKKVEFFGEITNEKIYEYLSRADVFARPSRSEGLGTAFLEAMAAGLPVIATPVGGIPDFLKDGKTGLFCKVDDPGDLAEKIVLLFKNSELRIGLVRQGQELVLRDYSWNAIALRMKEIFDKMSA